MFFRPSRRSSLGSGAPPPAGAARSSLLGRLDAAGAIEIGTLNMCEFALGPTGHNAGPGDCRNPWHADHIACGSSSGGGAATLAARLAFGSFGSDTGGSVRLPASACGVLGLKPTNGRVTLAGMMPLLPSVDVPGIFARSARDVARLLGIVAGRDARDPRSSWLPVPDYEASVERGVAGLRIGVPQNFFLEGVAGDVALRLEESLQALAALGAEIVPVAVPAPEHLTELSRVLVYAEAAAIHGPWLRDHSENYSPQVRVRAATGLAIPAAAYHQAQQLRPGILRQFVDAVFSKCDVLHLPTLGIPVPTLAETDVGGSAAMWEKIAVLVRCTAPFNYLGLPALSVPCGFTDNGLPTSFQLVGRPFSEATLLATAHAYDGVTRSTRRCLAPDLKRRRALFLEASLAGDAPRGPARPARHPAIEQALLLEHGFAFRLDDEIAEGLRGVAERMAFELDHAVVRGQPGFPAEDLNCPFSSSAVIDDSMAAMIASEPATIRLIAAIALHSSEGKARWAAIGSGDLRCASSRGARSRAEFDRANGRKREDVRRRDVGSPRERMPIARDEIQRVHGHRLDVHVVLLKHRAELGDEEVQLAGTQAAQQLVPVPHLQADVDSRMFADEARQRGDQRRFDLVWATADGQVTRFQCPPGLDLLAEVIGQLRDLARLLDQQASEVRWHDTTARSDEEAGADMSLEALDAA